MKNYIYEKEILKDIQDLPEPMQEKLAKIIHLLKKSLFSLNSKKNLQQKNSFLYVEHGKTTEALRNK
ncbi:MAG: hypothetical protein NG747_09430 [Candidatus Brocadia sp.]|nr:hypothetical protein [Candidatus Brocadia sp.]